MSNPELLRYVTKPIYQDQLFDCIASVVNGAGGLVMHSSDSVVSVEPPEPTVSMPRVLVIEDNVVNQKVAAGLLRRFGCVVDVANDGAEGVRIWSEKEFDMILMDCHMPVMDGYEATVEIRKREIRPYIERRTAIIAMSAHSMEVAWEQCQQAGMDDYLAKPIKADALRAVVKRWLKPKPEVERVAQETAHTTSGLL